MGRAAESNHPDDARGRRPSSWRLTGRDKEALPERVSCLLGWVPPVARLVWNGDQLLWSLRDPRLLTQAERENRCSAIGGTMLDSSHHQGQQSFAADVLR